MNRIGIIIVGIIGLSALVLSVYILMNQPKVAYVHIQEVYNDFEYKKELEGKFDAMSNARTRVLDSLEIQLNALGANIQNSEVNKEQNIQTYQYLAAQYQSKQKNFTEDNQVTSEKYTEQIWTQLNKYVKEFGEKNGYDLIYGANGSGSIMHGNEAYNLTSSVKAFVNERYQGGGLSD